MLIFWMALWGSLHAESVKYLDNASKTMAATYLAIQSAKSSIDLAVYEAAPCDTSVKVLVDAIAAQKRQNPNLRIRLVVDDYPFYENGLSAKMWNVVLRRKGINLRIFNPSHFPLNLRYDHRLHSKFLVVDGKSSDAQLITGSTNWRDTHFGMNQKNLYGQKAFNFLDRNVWVTGGDSAQAAQENFNFLWQESSTPSDSRRLPRNCFQMSGREALLQLFLRENAREIFENLKSHSCRDAEFIADNKDYWIEGNAFEHPGGVGQGLEEERRRQVATKSTVKITTDLLKAGSKILIENFTYMPIFDIEDILQDKRRSGSVQVFTNYYYGSGEPFEAIHNTFVGQDSRKNQVNYALPATDHPHQHWALTPSHPVYLNHSKTMVIRKGQDVATVIGSFNVDARSYLLNLESMFAAYNCSSLAEDVEQSIFDLTSALSPKQQAAVHRRAKGYIAAPVSDPKQALWNLLDLFHQL